MEARRFLTRTTHERDGETRTVYSLNVDGRRLAWLSFGGVTSLAAAVAVAMHLMTLSLWPTIDLRSRDSARAEIDEAARDGRIVPYVAWQAHLRERESFARQSTDALAAINKRLDAIDQRQDRILDLLLASRGHGASGRPGASPTSAASEGRSAAVAAASGSEVVQ